MSATAVETFPPADQLKFDALAAAMKVLIEQKADKVKSWKEYGTPASVDGVPYICVMNGVIKFEGSACPIKVSSRRFDAIVKLAMLTVETCCEGASGTLVWRREPVIRSIDGSLQILARLAWLPKENDNGDRDQDGSEGQGGGRQERRQQADAE